MSMNDQATYQTNSLKRSPDSKRILLLRVLWGIVQATLFRLSPRPMYRWRIFLLKLFGADINYSSHVYPKARIWGPWNLSLGEDAAIADNVDVFCVNRVRIGARSSVSQYSYLCGATHDHEDPTLPLVPRPITIGADVWIAADVFVAPGITIGDGVVVGARSSVFGDLPEWTVCFGSPAGVRGERRLNVPGAGPGEGGVSP